jgi:aspartyl protease family protein
MRFLVLVAVVVGGILVLNAQFPGMLSDDNAKFGVAHSAVLLCVLAGSALFVRDIKLSEGLKYGLIWLGVLLVLVLSYSYRDVVLDSRLGAELMPGRARMLADGEVQLRRGEGGHFHALLSVNGVQVRFMVDTGASDIVLSQADARRAGYDVDALNYDLSTLTANGVGGAARIRINYLRLGSVELHDIPAMVNKAEMSGSLLGMRFLDQFRSYSVDGNTLTLIP